MVAAAFVVGSVFLFRVTSSDLVLCAVLAACGLLAGEVSRQVERRRRYFADTPHVNFSSVWTLGAALVLPPVLAAAVAVVLYAHLWWRSDPSGGYVSRFAFNVSNVIVSCSVTAWVARELGALPLDTILTLREVVAIGLLIAVYFMVNSAVAAATIALVRTDRSARQLLGSFNENILEVATLCMGMLAALLLAWHPALVTLLFVPVYALHRTVLLRQFEHAATIDAKTGLLNATAWTTLAQAALDRAQRHQQPVGILMIDLDHFRRVNNSCGHQAGDAALAAVALAIRTAVRGGGDRLCGRFGGEEFVVTLPGASTAEVERIADAIRTAINTVNVGDIDALDGWTGTLSASIGGAIYPTAGQTLDEVLLAADLALFAAKDAGRNRVCVKTS
ncbi:GGDEF domain-containing protein [Amycolatopsis sp. YIM 10]|uniref:GGDEF domain-containing protein n=1 Tax=Amycolatopsis sp. YIM 10 TaxID=2653857 RepID=UPI001883548E|nr:GGDEF domain-containing protein [Amycolatopsis sp. YIM 10]